MNKKIIIQMAVVLGFVFMIGCGSSEYEEGDEVINNPPVVTLPPVNPNNPNPNQPIGNLPDPIPYTFSLQGSNNGPAERKVIDHVQTDSILRVRVSARDGGRIAVNGYGYAPMYHCAKFTVTVAGRSWTTQKLKVGGSFPTFACHDAVEFDERSFDTRVANSIGPFKVEVSDALYDHYCSYFGFSCPLRPPYFTHKVNGFMEIQTNNTTGL